MRKVKDYYFRRAKEEGFLARSIFKLEELNRKYRFINRGYKVLDLGSSPGSWSQYAVRVVSREGLVVGVDIQPMKLEPQKNLIFLQRDILSIDPEELRKICPAFDVVLSDAAPSTTGVKEADAERSLELARRALDIALAVLKPSGNFVAKVFQGEAFPAFLKDVKKKFGFAKASKPPASRPESREMYVIGIGKIELEPLTE